MRREEKRKRFHEAVLRTLYPPPSSSDSEEEEGRKPVMTSDGAVNLGLENPDDFGESSSLTSGDEDDGSQAETLKLSRAQRKRLRKKKLKKEASRRGKIIGPLLPLPENDGVGSLQTEPQGVRGNAANEQVASSDNQPGDQQGGCSSEKKLKQRRIAKKLARERLRSTETGNSDQDKEQQSSSSKVKCDQDQELKSSNVKTEDRLVIDIMRP